MSTLERVFDDGPGFIPYIVAGDPDEAHTRRFVEALADAGASAIELGLPFSEPIAEGPTIQRGIERALSGGMTPSRYFELVDSLAVDVPLICMTYYNLIHRFDNGGGPDPFAARCAEVGIDGIIVPDLPAEESEPLAEACTAHGIDQVFIVAPTTTDERLARIRELGSGFVYVQARLGTTGTSDRIATATQRSLSRVSDWSIPAAVGFGISTQDQARTVIEAGADGAIVGSALVDIIEDGVNGDGTAESIADALETKATSLVAGVDSADQSLAPAVVSILADARFRSPPETEISVTSRGLSSAILEERESGAIPIIAEVKRTSPTTDSVRDVDPVEAAQAMVDAGAVAISVLTESQYFGGSVDALEQVRQAVEVPVLRKDFILDEQELDRVPADAVLIIERFVDDLPGLIRAAQKRGMEPLVEVHNHAGLERAQQAGATIIGINNRDLGTLSVDLSTVEELAPSVEDEVTLIAESGISTQEDVSRMIAAGADGMLIGSALMADDIRDSLDRLRSTTVPSKVRQGGRR